MKTLEYAGQIAKTLWDKHYKNGILQEKETRVERKEVSDSIPEIPESTHKTNIDILEKIAMDAFKEEEHPRDEDGKFSTKEESKEPEKEHVERMTRTLEKRLYGNRRCTTFSKEKHNGRKSKRHA